MEITVNDLLTKGGANIIDIRPVEKYNDNHIPGAINISFMNIINFPEKYLNKYQTYYIYCQRGVTSLKASQLLNAKGYKVFSIRGGYEEYILNS